MCFELKDSLSFVSNLSQTFHEKVQEHEKQDYTTDDPVGGDTAEPLDQII